MTSNCSRWSSHQIFKQRINWKAQDLLCSSCFIKHLTKPLNYVHDLLDRMGSSTVNSRTSYHLEAWRINVRPNELPIGAKWSRSYWLWANDKFTVVISLPRRFAVELDFYLWWHILCGFHCLYIITIEVLHNASWEMRANVRTLSDSFNAALHVSG